MSKSATMRVFNHELEDLSSQTDPGEVRDPAKRAEADRKAEALDNAIEALRQLEELAAARGDPLGLVEQLIKLNLQPADACDCDVTNMDDVEAWRHANHLRFNLAARQILFEYGQLETVRRTLAGRPEGQELLTHLLCDQPDPRWIGSKP